MIANAATANAHETTNTYLTFGLVVPWRASVLVNFAILSFCQTGCGRSRYANRKCLDQPETSADIRRACDGLRCQRLSSIASCNFPAGRCATLNQEIDLRHQSRVIRLRWVCVVHAVNSIWVSAFSWHSSCEPALPSLADRSSRNRLILPSVAHFGLPSSSDRIVSLPLLLSMRWLDAERQEPTPSDRRQSSDLIHRLHPRTKAASMAHLLIIGASKGIGREAVKQALDSGHSVRAMARRADRIEIDHPNLDKFNGDALDRDSVDEALEGMDTVVQTLGVELKRAVSPRPVRLFSKTTEILVEAMERAGVKRLIAVTGYGSGDSQVGQNCVERLMSRVVLGRAYDDKDRQELIIRYSNLEWVIARPVVLTPGPRTGRYQVMTDPKRWRAGVIARADVADFLIQQIEDDRYLGQTPVLSY